MEHAPMKLLTKLIIIKESDLNTMGIKVNKVTPEQPQNPMQVRQNRHQQHTEDNQFDILD